MSDAHTISDAVPSGAGAKPAESLLGRAMADDASAIRQMFRQFLPEDDVIGNVEYLGVKGWGSFGRKSFGCLTNKRVARIEIGFFDELIYQEALIDDINSILYYQPSRLKLYILVGILVFLAFLTFGLSLLLLPFVNHIYYRIVKSGIVFAVKEGVSVYMFANRARLDRVSTMLAALDRTRT